MNEPTSSNTSTLETWREALSAWVAALQAYAEEVGDSGPKVLGGRWRWAAEGLLSVVDSLSPRDTPAPDVRALMDSGDELESLTGTLASTSETFLDPNIRAAVSSGMSRTYSDRFGHLSRAVTSAREATTDVRRAVLENITPGSFDLDAATSAFEAAPRRAYATELYMRVLLCSDDARAPGLLEAAKDRALGLEPESPEAARSALLGYHPLQAMSYSPPIFSRPDAAAATLQQPPIDLSVARGTVATYNLAPLVDRRAALAFGPVASMFSGLNFKTVERLRTISRRESVPAVAATATATATATAATSSVPRPGLVAADQPVLVTFDGSTPLEMRAALPRAGAAGETWAPFAGSRGRVAAYGAASAAVILDGVRAGRAAGWTLDLRGRFEDDAAAAASPPADPSLVAEALAEALARRYDADPPETPGELAELATPEAFDPSGYIVEAISRVCAGPAEAKLRRVLAAPVQRIPYDAIEREFRLTQMSNILDASRAVWVALRDQLRIDPELFSRPRQRDAVLRDFRRDATAAARAAPFVPVPASLKFFAALVVSGAATDN